MNKLEKIKFCKISQKYNKIAIKRKCKKFNGNRLSNDKKRVKNTPN
ncbi:Hypothetical protein CCH01_000940 [Clostridium chauvoei JF4335]|nr:Hypothetical protein CCH01_000940 [Clostridium chauvoei JF4335]